jgi:hypothetical protein
VKSVGNLISTIRLIEACPATSGATLFKDTVFFAIHKTRAFQGKDHGRPNPICNAIAANRTEFGSQARGPCLRDGPLQIALGDVPTSLQVGIGTVHMNERIHEVRDVTM